MVGVHSYGKGRASVGLVTTDWVMGIELALSAIAGHKLRLHHVTPLHRLQWCCLHCDDESSGCIILVLSGRFYDRGRLLSYWGE